MNRFLHGTRGWFAVWDEIQNPSSDTCSVYSGTGDLEHACTCYSTPLPSTLLHPNTRSRSLDPPCPTGSLLPTGLGVEDTRNSVLPDPLPPLPRNFSRPVVE